MGDARSDHYEVLGVPPEATEKELHLAYLRLARRHHPDVPGGDPERMRAVNAAWAELGDPVRRAGYDALIRRGAPPVDRPATWPAHAVPDEREDQLDLDDTPYGGTVVLPRSMSVVPVGLFALSVLATLGGILLAIPALLGAGIVAFLLSCLLFVAAPFVALLVSRRSARSRL